jgi:tetratricopeptide (TPR) repeat protein
MQTLVDPSTDTTMPVPSADDRQPPRIRATAWLAVALTFVAAIAVTTLAVRGGGGDGAGTLDAAAFVEEGLQLHVDGQLPAAADRYRRATAADPANVLAHYNLGLVNQQIGRADIAIAEYRRTIELDPAYAPALHNLGVLVAATGDRAQAIALYQRAVKANPALAEAQFNLGLLLLEAGDVAGGNAAINAAIALAPSLKERFTKSGSSAASA